MLSTYSRSWFTINWKYCGLSKVATELWLENWKKKPMSTESGTTWGDQNPGIHRLMSLSKGRVNGDSFYLSFDWRLIFLTHLPTDERATRICYSQNIRVTTIIGDSRVFQAYSNFLYQNNKYLTVPRCVRWVSPTGYYTTGHSWATSHFLRNLAK